MAISNNDHRSYGARNGERHDHDERRGAGGDRAGYDRYGSEADPPGYARETSQEHRWQHGERKHDQWHGGRDDDRERGEYGGGQYGMGHYGTRHEGARHRGGAYGDDDAYAGNPSFRARDFDRDIGNRDFGRRDGGNGHGWYGGEHGWYGGEHTGGGMTGRRRGGGLRSGDAGSGGYRHGRDAMGMSAGLGHGSSMTGKGPRGYSRSDDRIREDVCDCLTDDPHLDASSIEVQVRSGEVTLSGTVDSRNAKRHAEDLAERASGVKNVQNSLRVQAVDEGGMTGSSIT
jgi:hypothetical protein